MVTANRMRNIAKRIKAKLPEGFGFTLLVFPFGKPGLANYISNADREDMIHMLRETADRIGGRDTFQTPEEN